MGEGLQSVILKVAGRCNINCSYCYMYNLVDQTHGAQPRFMSEATIEATFTWIEQLLLNTVTPSFQVFLHGGEPLLAGRERIKAIAERRSVAEKKTGKRIRMSLLTNGTLLDDEWAQLFATHDIRFGISLDGPEEYHDRFRRTHTGAGTHEQVERAVRWALTDPVASKRFSSVLCVLHPDMDGRKLIKYFYNLGLSGVDFLLPDQNHAHGSVHYPKPTDSPSYGRVLGEAYEEWIAIDDAGFYVRKFGMLLEALFGETPSLDSLGTGPITVFTIETSGEVEPVDSMKVCGDGFTKTGLNIKDATLENVIALPLIDLGLNKGRSLTTRCQSCRNRDLCGGGYLPHRFASGEFRETVYCSDMMHICDTIRDHVESAVSKVTREIPTLD